MTDSSIGKAFRRSVVQGARVADSLDEKWESLSDSLRDKSKCDKVTGRRLYDNGVRKDGTPIGNPGLGALCNPEPLLPLDDGMADKILDLAVESALVAVASGAGKDSLSKVIQQTKDLVRPSFERSIQNASSEDEKKKGQFSFEMYYTLRAISTFLKENNVSSKVFQIAWGEKLVSMYAPNASRRDYLSPFPVKDGENV